MEKTTYESDVMGDPATTGLPVDGTLSNTGSGRPPYCPQSIFYFVMFTLFDCPLLAFGLVGNALALVVLSVDKKPSATVFLLKCLAVSDEFVLIVMFPLTSSFAMDYLGSVFPFPRMKKVTLAYIQPCMVLFHMITTWFTVLVTWHRFIAACKPTSAARLGTLARAKLHALCVVIFAFLFNFPRFFEAKIIRVDGELIFKFTPLDGDLVYEYLYKVILYNLVVYVIPVTSLLYMTYRLLHALNEAKEKRKQMMSKQSNSNNQQDLTFSLVIVVIVFMLCQLVNPIRRVIGAVQTASLLACGSPYYMVIPLTAFAIVLNSSINFVIYTLCLRRFRQNLTKLFRKDRSVGPEPTATQTTNAD